MKDKCVSSHTFPIHCAYHRCPHCGLIQESRDNYVENFTVLEKHLTCPRCSQEFNVIKKEIT